MQSYQILATLDLTLAAVVGQRTPQAQSASSRRCRSPLQKHPAGHRSRVERAFRCSIEGSRGVSVYYDSLRDMIV
jgi:hypothetical protein